MSCDSSVGLLTGCTAGVRLPAEGRQSVEIGSRAQPASYPMGAAAGRSILEGGGKCGELKRKHRQQGHHLTTLAKLRVRESATALRRAVSCVEAE
jgi:hypothetical protein